MRRSSTQMLFTCLAVLLAAPACTTPPPPEPEPKVDREPPYTLGSSVAVPRQFDDDPKTGCIAKSSTEQRRGVLRVEPFGPKVTGVLLEEPDRTWAVSYDGEQPLFEQFDGVEVMVMGRVCKKQGQAVNRPHFDLQSLREIKR